MNRQVVKNRGKPEPDGLTAISPPLVTYLLVTFNQEAYVREAILSAFAQTYTNLEILISDDCSTDNTFGIIGEMVKSYVGKHVVVVRQSSCNNGFASHLNAAMRDASGDYIIVAAGDDISKPERTSTLVDVFMNDETIYCTYSNMITINGVGEVGREWVSGNWKPKTDSLLTACTTDVGVFGCSAAWHRGVFDYFGPLDDGVIHEDRVIPFRAMLLGRIQYVPVPLIFYRRHDFNTYQPVSEIKNLATFKAHRRKFAGDELALRRTMLKDLQVVVRERPSLASHAPRYQRALTRSLFCAETEVLLATSDLASIRLRCLARALPPRSPLRVFAKWLLVEFSPLWYLRLRGAKARWSSRARAILHQV